MELSLDQDKLGIKPELKILENMITLDYSIKGNDIKYGKEQSNFKIWLNKIRHKMSKIFIMFNRYRWKM